MSDIPIVPEQSDTSGQANFSRQADLEMVQKAAIGRHRMETALVHGRSQSRVDRRRLWPSAVAGLLTTGLIASGIGIAGVYQDWNDIDAAQPEPAPLGPVEMTVPTALPSSAPRSSAPARPTTKPSTALAWQITPALRQDKTTASPRKTDPPKSHQKPTSKPKGPTHVQDTKPHSSKPTTDKPRTLTSNTKPADTKPRHRGPKAKHHHRATPDPHSARPKPHGGKHRHHNPKPKHHGDKGKHAAGRSH